MWSSANGSGIRSHRTPGATATAAPGGGGCGERVVEAAPCGADAGIRSACVSGRIRYCVVHRRVPGRCHCLRFRRMPSCRQPMSCSPMPVPPPRPARAARPTRFRSSRRVRADHARDPLLRGRRPARAAAARPARVYGERERMRLKLILRGKRLGLALSEIARAARHLRGRAQRAGQLARSCDCWPTARAPAAAERGHRRAARRNRGPRARVPPPAEAGAAAARPAARAAGSRRPRRERRDAGRGPGGS